MKKIMNSAYITIGAFQKAIQTPKNELDDKLVAALKKTLPLGSEGCASLVLKDEKGEKLDHTYIIV